MSDDAKIPLPSFLKLFTDANLSMSKAINFAGKLYKNYNTPAKLSQLDEAKLLTAGIASKDDRRVVMTVIRNSGHGPKRKPLKRREPESSTEPIAGPSIPSTSSSVQIATTPQKKKQKRVGETNDLLPNGPIDEAVNYGNLEFGEVLDEEILKTKSTIVNRAPLMTAWATVVAERIGFRREEALSIATVYTEMNAVSKGVSLGIYEEGKQKNLEAAVEGSQPYVELISRSPLYKTQTAQWRALSNGSPVLPSAAFSYISRSFRQTTAHIMGALRLLASSYTPEELKSKAWGLYAEFRPTVEEWGKKSEVRCSTILNLRKKDPVQTEDGADMNCVVKFEDRDGPGMLDGNAPSQGKGMQVEGYETTLDEDTTSSLTNTAEIDNVR